MPEIQEIEKLQPETPEAQVRLYAAEKKSRARGKRLADQTARVVITAGGIAGGAVVPLKINFSVDFRGGKRTITQGVKEGRPLQVDPQGRPITALVYQEEEGKLAVAALVGPRTVLFFAQKEKTSLLG